MEDTTADVADNDTEDKNKDSEKKEEEEEEEVVRHSNLKLWTKQSSTRSSTLV